MADDRGAGWARGLIMLLLAAPVMAGCSFSRLGESMRVLEDVQAGVGPSALKERTPTPTCSTVTYRRDGVRRVADIYLPGDGRPALAG
ncbi:MAG: hypothetical protein OEY16_13965, partial [Alphaproteobacteria bacterium]|nr:hypothetical protein [Alphaproteobacteria bacterium]